MAKLTPRLTGILAAAEQAAQARRSRTATDVDLLSAIVRDGGSLGAAILRGCGFRGDDLSSVDPAAPGARAVEASAVLDLATDVMRAYHHTVIGTEHVVIAIACANVGAAADTLRGHGITCEAARDEFVRLASRQREGGA